MTQATCKTRVQSGSQGSDRGMILELVNCSLDCNWNSSQGAATSLTQPQRLHEHNNTSRRGMHTRVRIFVPLRSSGGAVMRREYVIQATPGRDGWVYLIHAQGTNRYKVGRSSNPVVRHQILQKQSPYPLEIIGSFWSVDAVNDEADIHDSFAEKRVYGEWFEFPPDEEDKDSYFSLSCLKHHFFYPAWINNSGVDNLNELVDFLRLHGLGSEKEYYALKSGLGHLVYEAYENVNSQAQYADVQAAFKEAIARIKICVPAKSKLSASSAYEEIRIFTCGVFAGLAIVLGKGRSDD